MTILDSYIRPQMWLTRRVTLSGLPTSGASVRFYQNIDTYLLLAEKAKAYREDPRVQAAFEAAGVFEGAKPTIAEGETLADLLADRSAFEDFDADAAGARETNYVALNQLALEHLIG